MRAPPSTTTTTSDSTVTEIKPSTKVMPLWKRIGMSVGSVAVFVQIGWCNLPDESLKSWLDSFDQLGPEVGYRAKYCDWMIRYYAYYLGLGVKWQMFGRQSRFNWYYVITGVYVDSDSGESTERILPLPRQSERSFIEENLLDFKEAKFLLNIYNDEKAREMYARYLARQFPSNDGKRISKIRFTLATQHILPPIIAVREQRLLEPRVNEMLINEFDVSAEHSGTNL